MDETIYPYPKFEINSARENLRLFRGEERIFTNLHVKDLIAFGEPNGKLYVTNLRITWILSNSSKFNINIPFDVVTNVYLGKDINEIIGLDLQTLVIKAKCGQKQYKFLFGMRKPVKPVILVIRQALKNFESTTLLRNPFLRTSLFEDKNIKLVGDELVVKQYAGVDHIKKNEARIGVCVITTRRFIWYSTMVENYNITVPLIMIPICKLLDHDVFGKCFHVELKQKDEIIYFGFTQSDVNNLNGIIETLNQAIITARMKPILTNPIQINALNNYFEKTMKNYKAPPKEVFIVEGEESPLLRYESLKNESEDSLPIVYDKIIGLSIEQSNSLEAFSKLWENVVE